MVLTAGTGPLDADVPDGPVLPLVSVITPTYNRAQYLGETVASVRAVAERVRDIATVEHIVVDDGSTDGTWEMLQQAPVRPFRNPRKGVSAARNVGIQQAQGQYLAFLDDDDVWLACHLRPHLELLAREPHTALAFSQGYLTDPSLTERDGPHPSEPLAHGDAFRWLLQNDVPVGTFVVRASVVAEVGGFDERLATDEDGEFLTRIAARHDFHGVAQPTVLWRQHPRRAPQFAAWNRRFSDVAVLIRNFRQPARVTLSQREIWHTIFQRRGWMAAHAIGNAQQCLEEGRPAEAARFLVLGALRASPVHCLRLLRFYRTSAALGLAVVGKQSR